VITVSNWLEGDFPGRTAVLQYQFELSDDNTAIYRLNIAT
jgi:hypothetical protein